MWSVSFLFAVVPFQLVMPPFLWKVMYRLSLLIFLVSVNDLSPGCPNDLHGRWIWPYQRGKQQHLLPWQLCKLLMLCFQSAFSIVRLLNVNTILMQLNYFRWDKKEEAHSDFFRFCRHLIKFREYVIFFYKYFAFNCLDDRLNPFFCSDCESLALNDFPTAKRLQWHGLTPGMPDWSKASRFVAFSLVPTNSLLIAYLSLSCRSLSLVWYI